MTNTSPFENLPGIDSVVGLSYVGQKPELYGRLLVKFRDGHGRAFRGAFDGAVASGAWSEARRLAHSLKSVARTLGAQQLGELAYRLEVVCAARLAAAAAAAGAADSAVAVPLEAVTAELARIVDGLQGLDLPAAAGNGDLTPQEMFNRLAYLLHSRDTCANDFAIECSQAFGELGHAAAAREIVGAIGRYDYKQALASVLELARELQIDIER